jgi:7-carboxy-7-deazaguanine synthase
MTKIYPVHERFYTFQGEGTHMGRPAFFIRMYGCPVKCPWCDSAGTWHPDWTPPADQIEKMTAEQLKAEIDDTYADIVVITGGEPTIFDLNPITDLFAGPEILKGPEVHLETSGAFVIQGSFHHVMLSPKKWKEPLQENVERGADEFKIIVEHPEDIPFYTHMLQRLGFDASPDRPVWLHPEWSHRDDPEVLNAISETVKHKTELPYRGGLAASQALQS